MSITNKKTVIFGGTFDPVTAAHADIIRKLSERFERTVVMPCKVSPFKSSASASAEQRLEMLKTVASGENVEISTFELEEEGTNYTYLTLTHFASEGLYLAMGSEMIVELEKWKRLDKICSLARLYIMPRPSFPIGAAEIDKLERLTGGNYEIADFEGESGSSSEVRISVAMGRADMFLTEDVARYVTDNGLYTEYNFVGDLYKRFRMKQKRIDHSFSTALCGVKLAKRACVDVGKATVALLLHDIGKYIPKEEAEAMGVVFDGRIDGMPLLIRHAEIGAEIIRQLLVITDSEIVEAVRWHTTGKPNMTPLEKVVYLADYIEPLRDFPTVEHLRAETAKSIDDGLFAALENSVKYVPEEEIYPITVQAYEYYKALLGKN